MGSQKKGEKQRHANFKDSNLEYISAGRVAKFPGQCSRDNESRSLPQPRLTGAGDFVRASRHRMRRADTPHAARARASAKSAQLLASPPPPIATHVELRAPQYKMAFCLRRARASDAPHPNALAVSRGVGRGGRAHPARTAALRIKLPQAQPDPLAGQDAGGDRRTRHVGRGFAHFKVLHLPLTFYELLYTLSFEALRVTLSFEAHYFIV